MHIHFDLRDKDNPDESLLKPAKLGEEETEKDNRLVDYIERGSVAVLGESMYAVAPSDKAFNQATIPYYCPETRLSLVRCNAQLFLTILLHAAQCKLIIRDIII